jgi:eukaryotic-like serine/threonine-protein kinase
MALSVAEFWKLAEKAQLLNNQQCQQWNFEFRSQFQPPEANNPTKMAEWLVSKNVFSSYQTAVLLAGHAGPFVYGDYKIYDRIEGGRLGHWFRAVHVHTGHPVMLHFLSGAFVQDARSWAIAATEVQVACGLLHPHVQRYFEVVDLGSFKFVVCEDLRGVTLEDRLSAGRLSPLEACRLARGMALGLAAVHSTGRPHGDLRPTNLWLDQVVPNYPETIKLLREAWLPPTTPNFVADDPQGRLLGQCDYLAPEFQMPGKTHDALTDIYALGCTLYHMLAGQPPFPGGTITQKMSRHAMEAIQPLENFGIPQPLGQIVMYLMAKNPAVRYQDAQTVADQLAAFVDPQMLHAQIPAAYPTLPAYEASLQQTHAKLMAQQQAANAKANASQEAALPTGKAVGGTAAISPGPVISTGAPPVNGAVVNPAKATLDPKAYAAAKEEREKKKMIVMLASIGAALILIIILVNAMGGKGTPDPNQVANTNAKNNETPVSPPIELEELKGVMTTEVDPPAQKPKGDDKTNTAVADAPVAEIVPDDGTLLWASPTTGKPVELKYVPPLAGMFVVLRPAEMIASPEGARVLHALGPAVQGKLIDWEKMVGIQLEQVEKLIFSLHDNESQFPGVSVVAHVKEALTPEQWLEKWGKPAEKKDGENTYYVHASGTALFIPPAENGKVIVSASEYLFKDALGNPLALLKQELSQLRLKTDDARHVNVLFNPSFLLSGSGDPLFAGDLKRVRDPLEWLMGEGLQAGSMSMHFTDSFYLEMRFVTKVDKEPYKLADEFRTRLSQVPENLTNYFAEQLNPPVYWKKFAFKYPSMIEKLHEAMRVGVEDKQAVVNVILPGNAAHNLVLGSELTIATAPSAMQVAATNTAAYTGPKTLEEAMDKLMIKDFSFAQQSLEKSVELLQDEIRSAAAGAPFEVNLLILGSDLQIDGITKNQSVRDFMQKDKTAAEVLTAIVLKANPITTVKDPSELDQKLIWIVAEDPESGKMSVLVTTRAAAEKRKNKLPKVFMPK